MCHLKPFCLILLFSFLGEVLHSVLPLPVPASIYGLLLFFAALSFKIVKVESVKSASVFLLEIMPLLFVAPAVNLLDCWREAAPVLLPVLVIVVLSTVVTFAVSGGVTRLFTGRRDKRE